MKLVGTDELHVALEARFGETDPYPTYEKDGRTRTRRAAWRCPSCGPDEFAAHVLTVALDPDGAPPYCSNGCSPEAIWRGLGGASRAAEPPLEPHGYAGSKRTPQTDQVAHNHTSRVERSSRKRTEATARLSADSRDPHRDVPLSEDISKGVISKDISEGRGEHEREVSRNPARVRVLGIAAEVGSEFGCVIKGHDHSAKLIATPQGYWLYQCAGKHPISLAQLRAAHEIGEIGTLTKILAARWLERLDYEAGLLTPRSVEIRLPESVSEATRRVAHGLALFLGLRDARWEGEPFTFARGFIVAYCGVTEDAARYAMETLEGVGVISRAEEREPRGKPIKWRLNEERT